MQVCDKMISRLCRRMKVIVPNRRSMEIPRVDYCWSHLQYTKGTTIILFVRCLGQSIKHLAVMYKVYKPRTHKQEKREMKYTIKIQVAY